MHKTHARTKPHMSQMRAHSSGTCQHLHARAHTHRGRLLRFVRRRRRRRKRRRRRSVLVVFRGDEVAGGAQVVAHAFICWSLLGTEEVGHMIEGPSPHA